MKGLNRLFFLPMNASPVYWTTKRSLIPRFLLGRSPGTTLHSHDDNLVCAMNMINAQILLCSYAPLPHSPWWSQWWSQTLSVGRQAVSQAQPTCGQSGTGLISTWNLDKSKWNGVEYSMKHFFILWNTKYREDGVRSAALEWECMILNATRWNGYPDIQREIYCETVMYWMYQQQRGWHTCSCQGGRKLLMSVCLTLEDLNRLTHKQNLEYVMIQKHMKS